jgi:hypothetical protein
MNDQELSDLLRQANEQSPKPSRQLAANTMQAYRAQFVRPSFFRRHWRLATAAGVIAIVGGLLATRPSTGSPLPPEYDRPGIVASGHVDWNGWTLEYSTVLRPANSGRPKSLFTTTNVAPSKEGAVIFHRYFGNTATQVYYGYDVVLHHERSSNEMTIQPLSEAPETMPEALRAAGSRLLEIRELPSQKVLAGQNIAVTLLNDPVTGQQVIDYVHVDTNIFDAAHHILSNMIRAFHSHFKHDGPPVQ